MSVYTSNSKAGPYIADGDQRMFPFNFAYFEDAHVSVYRGETKLPQDDYLVERPAGYNPETGDIEGGSIVFFEPPTAGTRITILREVPATQETDIQNSTAFYPEVLEDGLDKLTMICQQLAEVLKRCVKVDVASLEKPEDIINAVSRAKDITLANKNASAQSAQDAARSAQIAADAAAQGIAAHNNDAASHPDKLSLSGGTMTGPVTFQKAIYFPEGAQIRKSGNTGVPELLVASATENYTKWSYLILSPAFVDLVAGDGTTISRLRLNLGGSVTWNGLDITLGYPKYAAGVAVAASTIKSGYTAPSDGWILFKSANGGDASIGGVFVGHTDYGSTVFVPVKKGDVAKLNASNTPAAVFFPNR